MSKLTGGSVDISDVPVIGGLTIPETGVVISSGDAVPNMLPYVLDGILQYTMPITKGVSLVAAIPFVAGQPPVLFVLKIGSGGVKFSIRDPGRSLTVGNLIDAIVPDFNIHELTLPPGVSDILNIQMTRFELASKPKSLAVEFAPDPRLILYRIRCSCRPVSLRQHHPVKATQNSLQSRRVSPIWFH